MKSRWEHSRIKALDLRLKGASIRDIESKLGIPRSTLSGWFKGIQLTEVQKRLLDRRHENALVHARALASVRHRELKSQRIAAVRQKVESEFRSLVVGDTALEIALAMLYLGEGRKAEVGLGLGNSNPNIVRFYVYALKKLYGIKDDAFRVELHLRADQDEEELRRFWSRTIGLPRRRFKLVLKDKRTVGKPTYPHYKGVCLVTGGGVEIQRRLLYLAGILCDSHQ